MPEDKQKERKRPTRPGEGKHQGGGATTLIRAYPEDADKIKELANRQGISTADWIRKTLRIYEKPKIF